VIETAGRRRPKLVKAQVRTFRSRHPRRPHSNRAGPAVGTCQPTNHQPLLLVLNQ